MNEILSFALVYLAAISLCGLVLTVGDKFNAGRSGRQRVPERILCFTGILGGAIIMLTAMVCIRHKIRKPKFMLGFPLIIVVQLAVAFWLLAG